jgi:hypothetical protein
MREAVRRGRGGTVSVTRRRLTQGELLEAADTIRRLLAALRTGELIAPAMLLARIEGALVALEVIATGRAPTPEDLLEADSLDNTNHY